MRTEERSFNSQQKWMAVRVRHRALQATDVSSSCFVHSFPSACVFCILLPFCYPPTSSALSSLLTTLLPFLTTLLPFLTTLLPFSPHSSPSHHTPLLLTTLLPFSPHSSPSHHTPLLLTTLLPFSPLSFPSHHSPSLLTTLLPFSPLSFPSHHSPSLLTTLLPFSPLSFPSSLLSSTHPVSTLVSPSLEPIISTSSSSHLCVSSV